MHKHSDKFQKFMKIVGNLWKSSEIFVKNRKISQNAERNLPAFFEFFFNSFEIIGSLGKPQDMFGNLRKILKIVAKYLKTSILNFLNLQKLSEVRKKLENGKKFSKRSSDNF